MVKLEERKEEARLRELAEAGRKLKSAEDELVVSRARAHTDQRRASTASDWMVAELAHVRALSEVRTAEQAVRSAAAESTASRDRYAAAHSKAESIRRVAAVRVEEILAGRDAVERREHDELQILRSARGKAAADDEAASGN